MQKWNEIISQARQSVDFLKDQDVIRTVLNILQVPCLRESFYLKLELVYEAN